MWRRPRVCVEFLLFPDRETLSYHIRVGSAVLDQVRSQCRVLGENAEIVSVIDDTVSVVHNRVLVRRKKSSSNERTDEDQKKLLQSQFSVRSVSIRAYGCECEEKHGQKSMKI